MEQDQSGAIGTEQADIAHGQSGIPNMEKFGGVYDERVESLFRSERGSSEASTAETFLMLALIGIAGYAISQTEWGKQVIENAKQSFYNMRDAYQYIKAIGQ